MQRFDINNSDYAHLFSSQDNGQVLLQSLLNEVDTRIANTGWAFTQGKKAAMPTPTNADGVAAFMVKSRKLEMAPLMDLRAPLGDSNQMDNGGVEVYTATIPDFIARGWTENAKQREYKERMFSLFGNDNDLVKVWVRDVALSGVNSAKSTLDLMTAQLETKGLIDWRSIGGGISAPIHKQVIPSDNFLSAGEKVWTAEDCKILTQMRKIEDAYRDSRGGYAGALVWKMTKNTYNNVFLQNAEVKALYQTWCKANYVAYVEGMPITSDQFIKAISDIQGISPIEVVAGKQRNLTQTSDTVIQGWSDDIVVLRPAGDAVEFMYTPVLDEELVRKFGSNLVDSVFGSVLDGLAVVMNTTTQNGRFKEWHTDVMMSACPALLNFTDHCIVNIAQAD